MKRGTLNLIIGVALVIGGLSGKVALIGTNSGTALAILGGVIAGVGIFQLTRGSGAR